MKDITRFLIIEIDFLKGKSCVLEFSTIRDILFCLDFERSDLSTLYEYGELNYNGKKYHMITTGQINNKVK